jgi:5-methylcytosine-specific restriction protein A
VIHRDRQEVDVCHLCGRSVPARLITHHHLTPRQKGGTHLARVPLCRPCHKQIHATFSNAQLARELTDLSLLRAAPQLQPFLNWIQKQKPDRNFRTVRSNDRPLSKRERRRK